MKRSRAISGAIGVTTECMGVMMVDIYTVWNAAEVRYEGENERDAYETYFSLNARGWHARLEKNGILVKENLYQSEEL